MCVFPKKNLFFHQRKKLIPKKRENMIHFCVWLPSLIELSQILHIFHEMPDTGVRDHIFFFFTLLMKAIFIVFENIKPYFSSLFM